MERESSCCCDSFSSNMHNMSFSAPNGDHTKGFLGARLRPDVQFEADTAALRRRSSVVSRWLVLVEKWLLLHAAKYPASATAEGGFDSRPGLNRWWMNDLRGGMGWQDAWETPWH